MSRKRGDRERIASLMHCGETGCQRRCQLFNLGRNARKLNLVKPCEGSENRPERLVPFVLPASAVFWIGGSALALLRESRRVATQPRVVRTIDVLQRDDKPAPRIRRDDVAIPRIETSSHWRSEYPQDINNRSCFPLAHSLSSRAIPLQSVHQHRTSAHKTKTSSLWCILFNLFLRNPMVIRHGHLQSSASAHARVR